MLQFNFFAVGEGDCVAIQYDEKGYKRNILIDCGSLNLEVENYIVDNFNKHIDALIITHIDDDHIKGVIELLSKYDDLVINKIYYNSFGQTISEENPEELSENDWIKINLLMKKLPSDIIFREEKVSAAKSCSLTDIITNKYEWNNVWEKEPISTNNGRNNFSLSENTETYLLSPTNQELDDLNLFFKYEFSKIFYKKYNQVIDEKKLFELLIRIADKYPIEKEFEIKVSASRFTPKKFIDANLLEKGIDSSKPNRSSIAFIWEINGLKLLLLADAAPDVILNSIKEYKKKKRLPEDKPILFDLIKVPHHGSSRNITSELMQEVDSERYVLSGYSTKRPDLIALSKIINRPLPNNINKRIIYTNAKNNHIADIIKNREQLLNTHNVPNFEIIETTKISFDANK